MLAKKFSHSLSPSPEPRLSCSCPVPKKGALANVTDAGQDAVDAAASGAKGSDGAEPAGSVSCKPDADVRRWRVRPKSCGPGPSRGGSRIGGELSSTGGRNPQPDSDGDDQRSSHRGEHEA